MSDLVYAYGIVRAAAPPLPAGVRGVAGTPVRTVRQGELAALVGAVPGADFTEQALRERLEELAWLEATARAHQGVVDAAASPGPVLPLRLATVYRDEDGVRAMLSESGERFAEALAKLDGRVEWGVKVYATRPAEPPARTPAPATATASVPTVGAATGRDYLRRRRRERDARESDWEQAAELARQVHEALRGHAESSRLHRPQDARLSGTADPNVLNAAYLVPRGEADGFAARVKALAASAPRARVELTGPWAPYSFAADVTDGGEEAR